MVLNWNDEYGWSLAQLMGAFSVALAMQGLVSKRIGRLLDDGHGTTVMAFGAVISVVGIFLLTQTTSIFHFYAIWAVLGIAMGLTLYDAVFALLIRSRGEAAMESIALITLVSGLASSAAFMMTALIGDIWGWRAVLWVLAVCVLCIHLPLIVFATRRLERSTALQKQESAPIPTGGTHKHRGFWPLTAAISFSALGLGMIMSHLLALLDWLGMDSSTALMAAALVGLSQVAGRLSMAVFGRNWDRLPLAVACLCGLAAAPGILLGSAHYPIFLLVFSVLHGACYGISSILRPMLIRDVLGHAGFGRSQGAVLGPAFIAFGAAPFLAAVLVETQGFLSVIAVCVASQALGAILLRNSPQVQQSEPVFFPPR